MSELLMDMDKPEEKEPPIEPHRLVYGGTLRGLFGIYFINLGLIILTLGTYRFWAKVRLRKYLWSHMFILGEPFQYTGIGKELFKGFFKILFLIFVPIIILLRAFGLMTGITIGTAGLLAMFAVLWPYITFWVRRYRLNRSSWRGIRFQQSGEAKTYMLKALRGRLLTIISLGLYAPFNAANLFNYQINHIHFGSMRFDYDGDGDQIKKDYMKLWLFVVIGSLVSFVGMIVFAMGIGALLHNHKVGILQKSVLILVSAVFYILLPSIFVWASIKYRFILYRHIADHTSLGGMSAIFDATFWQYFRLRISNFFLRILSLGLLSPIVTHRKMKFLCRHFFLRGVPDLESVKQIRFEAQSGEGWTHWFDVDALDF